MLLSRLAVSPQMQVSMQSRPAFAALVDDPEILKFIENTTVFDADYLLHQLDVVDNAACSWSVNAAAAAARLQLCLLLSVRCLLCCVLMWPRRSIDRCNLALTCCC